MPGGQEGIQGIPWDHKVGLMSLFMIQRHIGLYISDPDFSCGQVRQPPELVQEVLPELKRSIMEVYSLPNFLQDLALAVKNHLSIRFLLMKDLWSRRQKVQILN